MLSGEKEVLLGKFKLTIQQDQPRAEHFEENEQKYMNKLIKIS